MALTDEISAGLTRLANEVRDNKVEVAFALDGYLLEAGQTAANLPAGLPVGSLVFRKA